MRFEFRTTQDGSLTVFDAAAGECFKSRHAAQLEVQAVFLNPGIRENPYFGLVQPFRILELGFGLGTNFLALAEERLPLHFTSIERDLSGAKFFLEGQAQPSLAEIVATKKFRAGDFHAELLEGDFFSLLPAMAARGEKFHAIFFDPFSPKANPEAWTDHLFRLASALLYPSGRLVTYSVCRSAKDSAVSAGLEIAKHKLPSALKKRSALVAVKPADALQ